MNILKPGRVLLPNFQYRVLLGLSTFAAMMLLVIWITINEPSRMDVFTQQYNGRSIENGAATFTNNCALCHGADGKGLPGRAPALNNPMLFIKENPAKTANAKLSDLQQQQTTLQGQLDSYNKNVQDLAAANDKLKTVQAGSPDEQTLKQQIDQLNASIKAFDQAATQKKLSDLGPQIDQAKADVQKYTDQGWDPNRDPRLTEVKWTGQLRDYLASTVISGRPVSAAYWPQPMPAWGQQAGGPLRTDQIQDVVSYIMNFQDGALKLTPKDVQQQFKIPAEGGAAAGGPKVNASGKPVGTNADIKALVAAGLGGGDANAGQQKYTSLGCIGCHGAGTIAPATAGTDTRVVNQRLKDAANAGKTPEYYLAESIIYPNNYIAPGFAPGVMPQDWGTKLDLQDIKDLIAFLETQK